MGGEGRHTLPAMIPHLSKIQRTRLYPTHRTQHSMRAKEKGQKTPPETVMTTAPGVTNWYSGEFMPVGEPDHTIKEMGSTARREYLELQEGDINVTKHKQNIFIKEDITGEIESTCNNNPDMMGTSTHQQAQINGGVATENVLTSPIRGTALRQGGGVLRTEGVRVENNTRGNMDRMLNNEEEHLLDTIGRPRMKSHQLRLRVIADVGSPNVVVVLMADGRVLAKIIEQMQQQCISHRPMTDMIRGYLYTRRCV